MKQMGNNNHTKSLQTLNSGHFLTDGRLETSLIHQYHAELVHFAAFELLYTREGRQLLKKYHEPYLAVAARYRLTYILETPTWRANPDWVFRLGYPSNELPTINRHAVQFLRELQYSMDNKQMVISGCVGPRRDTYNHGHTMTSNEAQDYHIEQIRSLALADVDVVSALTISYADEAIGIVRAARSVGVPVVISFTLADDGLLPSGESLVEAIAEVDYATGRYAHYFMVNCTQLQHFHPDIEHTGDLNNRLHGIRVNAANPEELPDKTRPENKLSATPVRTFSEIQDRLPRLQVIGGCGG